MESPFFRHHWNYHPQPPRYVPTMMEVPVYRRTVPVAPKVVSIPVRFVESKKSRSDSATKIQKVFRGFLVRKSVKKVVAIEREVDEIERRLADEETVELIGRDAKERVKFGEMLMSLLFRLDSVKGVDSGIRNFRKAVIKKAIALQEKVDETLEAGTAECDCEAVDRSSEINASGAKESGGEETPEVEDRIPEHVHESCAADIADNESADDCGGGEREIESADGRNEVENVAEHSENLAEKDALVETIAELKVAEEVDDSHMVHCETEAAEDHAAMSEPESLTDSSNTNNPPNSVNGVEEYAAVDEKERGGIEEHLVEEEEEEEDKRREEDGQSRELLEKMMMDNQKMMELMAQLFEKNEIQTRLLCSLSHRVEQLEKAFVYQMLTRKKKRNSAESSEKCPKTKKCGK